MTFRITVSPKHVTDFARTLNDSYLKTNYSMKANILPFKMT